MSVKDIQVFINFVNFYQRFIQGFQKIAILLISILKTTELFKESEPKAFTADHNKVVREDGSKANETVVNSSKKSQNLTCVPNIGARGELTFLTPNTKKIFNHLRQAFIKASILPYFNPKNHIRIKTNVLYYIIDKVLSQLNFEEVVSSNFDQ